MRSSFRFRDRIDAGRQLAERLKQYAGNHDLLVLGLPRGGVPIAYEVAKALGARMDVMMVRKLGVPGEGELAMGALASGGVCLVNTPIVQMFGISDDEFERSMTEQRMELDRSERLIRGDRPPFIANGRTVILVDDGVATGSTMMAAAEALRLMEPSRLVIAVPTGPESTVDDLAKDADDVICIDTQEPFVAVGDAYGEFPQVSDDEVRRILAAADRTAHEPTRRTDREPTSSSLAPEERNHSNDPC